MASVMDLQHPPHSSEAQLRIALGLLVEQRKVKLIWLLVRRVLGTGTDTIARLLALGWR